MRKKNSDLQLWLRERLPDTPLWDRSLRSLVKGRCRAVASRLSCEFKLDRGLMGMCSFEQAAFFRPNKSTAPRFEKNPVLGVQVSMMAPYFVMQEQVLGNIPAFEEVDAFPTPAVKNWADLATIVMADDGFVRLSKREVSEPLPARFYDVIEESLLRVNRPLLIYDALFFWID